MSAKMEQFMIVNSATGEEQGIMGKYMYYSLPKLIVKNERVKEICEQLDFPFLLREHTPVSDAFRSATGDIHDRIEEPYGSEHKICRIYCRDNKKVAADVLSRELVEETLYESTNTYRKLANITLDKKSNSLVLSDVDYSSDRNIIGYFEQAEMLFNLYRDCVSNRSIEYLAEKYVFSMHAISFAAKGHHYFIPKAYMHQISLLEDFLELVCKENLYTYANKRDATYISIHSMFVTDDAEQRRKMANEFYKDMGQEIEEYQKRMLHLIQNGNNSQKILDRWEAKIATLEQKKREYETILKQDLSGIDEEFAMLRDICDQFKLSVRRSQVFGLAA